MSASARYPVPPDTREFSAGNSADASLRADFECCCCTAVFDGVGTERGCGVVRGGLRIGVLRGRRHNGGPANSSGNNHQRNYCCQQLLLATRLVNRNYDSISML